MPKLKRMLSYFKKELTVFLKSCSHNLTNRNRQSISIFVRYDSLRALLHACQAVPCWSLYIPLKTKETDRQTFIQTDRLAGQLVRKRPKILIMILKKILTVLLTAQISKLHLHFKFYSKENNRYLWISASVPL